eukprot:TRINITY_DN978_c0_g1_i11.p1 TRINITY_DN978_c0_g1~~TRINITY_DN978_c0_g1_i11.p1  ORF type:complete len:184 (+),score=42.58 TRINITY_DN978_c0_g1_i11:1752-2303(+)
MFLFSIESGDTIEKVVVGWNTTFILTGNGKVYAMGANVHGVLGLGDKAPRRTPTLISAFDGVFIVSVATKLDHTLFLDNEGNVYSTGYNNRGQLGINSTVTHTSPVKTSLSAINGIAVGVSHSVAWQNTGGSLKVWTTGDNINGELGNGSLGGFKTVPHQPYHFNKKVLDAAGGNQFTVLKNV